MLRWAKQFREDLVECHAIAVMYGRRFPWFSAWVAMASYLLPALMQHTWCRWFGHKWDHMASIGPESGSEDHWCTRCGSHHHIIWY